MRVNFFATLRHAVGEKTIEVDLPEDSSAREVLDAALSAHPALVPLMLDPQGELSRYVHMFINGRGVVHLPDGLETKLKPGDAIDFFPAVAGG